MVDHFSIHDKDGAEDMLMGHRSRTPDERRQKNTGLCGPLEVRRESGRLRHLSGQADADAHGTPLLSEVLASLGYCTLAAGLRHSVL